MSGLLDTSFMVRYLTGDPPELAARVAQVIDGEERLVVTDLVIAETAYVLTSVYRVAREVLVDSLMAFLQKRNIDVWPISKDLALDALLLCRPSGRVSFADAMIWAAARSGEGVVYSLDRRFPNDGIDVREH